jgi:hypothetical protein
METGAVNQMILAFALNNPWDFASNPAAVHVVP